MEAIVWLAAYSDARYQKKCKFCKPDVFRPKRIYRIVMWGTLSNNSMHPSIRLILFAPFINMNDYLAGPIICLDNISEPKTLIVPINGSLLLVNTSFHFSSFAPFVFREYIHGMQRCEAPVCAHYYCPCMESHYLPTYQRNPGYSLSNLLRVKVI